MPPFVKNHDFLLKKAPAINIFRRFFGYPDFIPFPNDLKLRHNNDF